MLAKDYDAFNNTARGLYCSQQNSCAGLADNFKKIPADQQYKLLRSVIDALHVDLDGDAWIFLLEKAEAWQRGDGRRGKKKEAHEKVRGPSKWLRLLGSNQRPADEQSAACSKSLVRRKNRVYS